MTAEAISNDSRLETIGRLEAFQSNLLQPLPEGKKRINTSTVSVLREMFGPHSANSVHYLYNEKTEQYRPPEEAAKLIIMQDVLDIEKGVLGRHDIKRRVAEIMHYSCTREDGTFDDSKFGAETFMLFRALEYLYPARKDQAEFRYRLEIAIRAQNEAQELMRHRGKGVIDGQS